MTKFLILLFFCSFAFISCDGRNKAHMSNIEVLKEHKLLDSFSEKTEYIPEKYTETITDTILSNGFKIKIKKHLDMNNAVLKKYKVDSVIHKQFYREFIFDVNIEFNSIALFNNTIDKKYLLDRIKVNRNNTIIKDIFIDPKCVLSPKSELYLVIIIYDIITKENTLHQFIINNKGDHKIR